LLNKCRHDLCCPFNVICVYELKDDERGKACGTYEDKRDKYIKLVGKAARERPLGRPTRRWYNNIKICLSEISEILTVINLAEDRSSGWLF
jgi:hypothetical protein